MTDREAAGSCLVSLLVPHPRRTAILVAEETTRSETQTSPGQVRMPTLRLPSAEPLLPDILASVDVVDTGRTAVLRQVVTSSSGVESGEPGQDGEVSLMVEFEAGVAEPPPGWTWRELDVEAIERLEPSTSRAAVARWAHERAEGWSPLRPAWSHPGWFARASTWMVEQLAAAAQPAVGAPRQHHLWGLSVVLRVGSAEGDVFLKCSSEVFRHEAVTTQAMAALMPGLVPEVIAVDGAQGWMLMRDLGAGELGDQDESLWHRGIAVHARIQQLWMERTDDLVGVGLPVRSLTDLAEQVARMSDDSELLGRMSPELRERWLATAPTLVESCRRLDEIGPGHTLVHGDFHPWNVVVGADGMRVFDWTDAAVSHPFVDLATYVFRTQDASVRRGLVDACVDAWSTHGSEKSLREAVSLGLVVGALYQVQSYRTLLPTLIENGTDDGMAQADLDWINRSLTRHQQGLESLA